MNLYQEAVEKLISMDWVESVEEDDSFQRVSQEMSRSLDPIDPYTLREMATWNNLGNMIIGAERVYFD